MKEERKQQLRQLLQEAITSLEIQPRSANKSQLTSINVHEYRSLLQQRWASYSETFLAVVIGYKLNIVNKDAKSKLLDFIRVEFAPFIQENRIQSASFFIGGGGLSGGYPLDYLLEQLLKIAIGHGIERAISNFDTCIEDTHASFQDIALLEGVRIEAEIQVFEGIKLVPLPSSTSELPHYLRNFSVNTSHFSAHSFLGKTMLIIDYSISPIFRKPFNPTTIQEHSNLLNRAFQVEIKGDKLLDSYVADFSEEFFFQALSLSCNSTVQAALKWRFLAEDALCNLNYTLPGYTSTSGPFGGFAKSGRSHIEKAKCLYHNLINLNSKAREKLQIAINRWMKSKTYQNPVDTMIDLGIAFESLYLPGTKDELTFKLGVRASWLLGKNKDHRKKLMAEFKAIYKCRSTGVHDGKLEESIRIEGETISVSEFITRTQDLCRQSIMKILEQTMKNGSFPENDDWDDLILG